MLLIGVGALLVFELEGIIRQRTLEEAATTNQQMLSELKALRTYYNQNIVTKALNSGALKTSTNYAGDPKAIPFPATFLHDAGQIVSGKARSVEFFSPYPFANRSDRQLKPTQQEAWDRLSQYPDETFAKSFVREGREYLMIAVADRMAAETCVQCHNSHTDSPKRDWKIGDVRAVLATTIPLAALHAQTAEIRDRIITFVGITIAVSLAIYFFVIKYSSRRLTGAIATLGRAVHGQEVDKFPEKRNGDETDDIFDAIRGYLDKSRERDALAAERLQDMNKQAGKVSALGTVVRGFEEAVQQSTGSLRKVADALQRGSKSLDYKATTFAQEATNAEQASRASAAEIDAANHAVSALSQSLSLVAENARRSLASAKEAANEASMTRQTIGSLRETMQRVDGVIDLIKAVASQTNLLALNATIEASRASEAGRGFAVVASEVKQLSSQTTRATEDMSREIDAIRAAFDKVAGSFDSVVGVIGSLATLAAEIHGAVDGQVLDVAQLANHMKAASQTSKAGLEAALSVDDASDSARAISEEILGLSEHLAADTKVLETRVAAFLNSMQSVWSGAAVQNKSAMSIGPSSAVG